MRKQCLAFPEFKITGFGVRGYNLRLQLGIVMKNTWHSNSRIAGKRHTYIVRDISYFFTKLLLVFIVLVSSVESLTILNAVSKMRFYLVGVWPTV